MDTYQFISKITESLSWPITIIICIIILRKHISNLLNPLTKIKYGNLEMDFSMNVKEIENNVSHVSIKSDNKNVLGEFRDRILQLIVISPKAAIIEAWRFLETNALDAVKRSNIELKDNDLKKPINIVKKLREKHFIDIEIEDTFRKLRELRNESVHYEKLKVNPQDAISYLNSVCKLSSIFLKISNNK